MTTIYGIKNCDAVKKARNWLREHSVEHHFHDFRTDGLTIETLNTWIDMTDWEIVLNRRGTTWRKLADEIKEKTNEGNVSDLLLANLAMIKRPILDYNGGITIGFQPELYESVFNI